MQVIKNTHKQAHSPSCIYNSEVSNSHQYECSDREPPPYMIPNLNDFNIEHHCWCADVKVYFHLLITQSQPTLHFLKAYTGYWFQLKQPSSGHTETTN
jgi:hypothetical protein